MANNQTILFSDCLKGLLEATGLKCKKLAQQLNFEYSTVYKWKGGQRIPPSKNYKEIIKEITDTFVIASLEDVICLKRLWTLVKKNNNDINIPNEINLVNSTQSITDHINTMLLSGYLKSKELLNNDRDIEGFYIQPGTFIDKQMTDKMYYGVKEVAEQFSNLIKYAMECDCSMDKPIIYLNITNKINPVIGDFDKDGSYIENITNLMEKGWKLDLALCIDKYKHNSTDVSNTVTNFFPMFSKKGFSMKYMYMDTSRRQLDSILIIPEVGAILTFTLDDWAGNEFCYMVRDKEAVALLYRYYIKRLESTRSLYSFHSFDWYLKTIRYSQQAGEDNMVVSRNIGYSMMPIEELGFFVKSVWSERFTDDNDLDIHVEDTVKFYDTISGNSYQHIMSLNEFSDYIRNGKNNIMGFECNINVDQRIKHLEHILKIVEGNTNVELLLLDETEFDSIKGLTLNMNSSNKALLNILDDKEIKSIDEKLGFIMITEPFVVNGLKTMFKRIWQNSSSSILIKKGSTDWLKAKIGWLKDIELRRN